MKFPLIFIFAGQILNESPRGPPTFQKPAPSGVKKVLKAPQGPPGPPGAPSRGRNGKSSAALLSYLFAVIHNKIKNKELMLLIFNKEPSWFTRGSDFLHFN